MNKIAILFIFIFCININSQDKLYLDAGTGILSVQRNSAALFNVGLHYDVSQKISISGNTGYSHFNLNNNVETDISKYDLGINYKILNSNTKIASTANFNYITDKNAILFERKKNFGMDLGILVMFNHENRLQYGIKWYNTFSTTAKGSIMYSGAQFSYKL